MIGNFLLLLRPIRYLLEGNRGNLSSDSTGLDWPLPHPAIQSRAGEHAHLHLRPWQEKQEKKVTVTSQLCTKTHFLAAVRVSGLHPRRRHFSIVGWVHLLCWQFACRIWIYKFVLVQAYFFARLKKLPEKLAPKKTQGIGVISIRISVKSRFFATRRSEIYSGWLYPMGTVLGKFDRFMRQK